MERISLVPNRLKSAVSLDSDSFINLELNSTTKPITEYTITNIVNQQDLFDEERIANRTYRFSGKINIYTNNELTPETEASDENWEPLFNNDVELIPKNWYLQLLYPDKKDGDFLIKYIPEDGSPTIESKAEQGPQIVKLDLATQNGDEQKLGVYGVQKHNLIQDDFVYIYGTSNTPNPYTGIYRVLSLGIDGEDLDTKFILDTPFNGTFTTNSNYRRMVNVTQGDINFENSKEITVITATDINGGTSGSFLPNETIYTRIQTNTPHNIVIASGSTVYPYIDLRGSGNLNGIFEITSIIDENTFTIKLNFFNVKGQSAAFITNRPRFRVLDATPSEYYVRKFKVLSGKEYDIYKCAFSTSIYPKTTKNSLGVGNGTWLYHFNADYDFLDLSDHQNKPVTQIYLGLIKRGGSETFNWSNVVAGWDFNKKTIDSTNGIETISNYVNGDYGTIEKQNVNSHYIGDYVEYNKSEIVEKTISKVIHRFGVQPNINENGYYLDPFKKLQIMVFSDIVEFSSIDEPTEGIPNYAETFPNGTVAWKDLLNIGYFEPGNNGVEYPFVNGKHYVYDNYNFFIRVQKPFEEDKHVIDQSDVKVSVIQDVC